MTTCEKLSLSLSFYNKSRWWKPKGYNYPLHYLSDMGKMTRLTVPLWLSPLGRNTQDQPRCGLSPPQQFKMLSSHCYLPCQPQCDLWFRLTSGDYVTQHSCGVQGSFATLVIIEQKNVLLFCFLFFLKPPLAFKIIKPCAGNCSESHPGDRHSRYQLPSWRGKGGTRHYSTHYTFFKSCLRYKLQIHFKWLVKMIVISFLMWECFQWWDMRQTYGECRHLVATSCMFAEKLIRSLHSDVF